MKHVIIGSGAAGIAAAKTIRNLSTEDEIVLVSSDEVIYSRCMLHKYSGNERNLESLSFVPDNFFSKNNITWYKDESVTNVNTQNKYIQLKDKTISYDKLLIATGSDAITPNIGNLKTAKNVYSFRHLADAKAVREKTSDAENIIVIGAGLVGLDIAYALINLKKSVTVIDMAPHIMSLNLDNTAAAVYQKLFEQNGCTFMLNNKIVNTLSNKNEGITNIVLETGEILSCDIVFAAVGVSPSIKFLDNSGIKCEHGIVVDQYLMTSCENVYAAGGVTALGDIWPCAVRQGETAAKNMCGTKTVFTDTFSAKNTLVFFDLPTISIGNLNSEKGDTVFTREGVDCYQKIILRNNHVIGTILQGNIAYSGIWQYLTKNEIDLSQLKKPIWDISFADFYDIDKETGKYIYKKF